MAHTSCLLLSTSWRNVLHPTSHQDLSFPLPLGQFSLIKDNTIHLPKSFDCTNKITQSSGLHISCDENNSSRLLKANGYVLSILTDGEMAREGTTRSCKLLECEIAVGLVDFEYLEGVGWNFLSEARDGDIEERSVS